MKPTFAELTAALLLVGGKWDHRLDNAGVWAYVDHEARLKRAVVDTLRAYRIKPDLRPEVRDIEVTYTSCRVEDLRKRFPDCDLWR